MVKCKFVDCTETATHVVKTDHNRVYAACVSCAIRQNRSVNIQRIYPGEIRRWTKTDEPTKV